MESVLFAPIGAEVSNEDSVSDFTVGSTQIAEPAGYQLVCRNRDAGDRAGVETYIADRFREVFSADINVYHPFLVSREMEGKINSAVGVRPGTQRPLFLEQYLEGTLEQAVELATGAAVKRSELVEIGNLASCNRFASRSLFLVLTAALAEAGFTWVVFTATEQIRSILKLLDFHPSTLCAADPRCLPDRGRDWGSYYDSKPLVQAGDIAQAMQVVSASPALSNWLALHQADVEKLAGMLKNYLAREQVV